ncbi:PcfJ domain-containing protein [Aquisphaera insulae]|uniref:PcfJ domain-containing protein n=1 Tax=Aquisphaera insulae TaxID=2712864 RepID=UPI0013EB408A|nr:PcfJ domain-containing protein [Aquisphaera insulae]
MRPISSAADPRRNRAAKSGIDRIVHRALGLVVDRDDEERNAFLCLLHQVQSRSNLLRPPISRRLAERLEPIGVHSALISGLRSLAAFHRQWLRPVESWSPAETNPRPQFVSLARHLLAAYDVPGFLTSVWLEGSTAEARRHQGWFVDVGSGRNIRNSDLPLRLSKMMAHHFLLVPDHFKVDAALRWGQVRGLGGSESLARAVIATRLGRSFEAPDFWETVIRFFVNHPELDLAKVDPIIEYLYDRRFVPQPWLDLPEGEGEWRPPQPDLMMKGRTLRSLWRNALAWQQDRGMQGRRPFKRWPRSEIGEFRLVEAGIADRPARSWAIRELLTSRELQIEGSAMHHCVGTCYLDLCLTRRASIWSMSVEDVDGRRRVLTIEVNPDTMTVVQAKRCCNARPRPKDLQILGLWAERQGLTVEI